MIINIVNHYNVIHAIIEGEDVVFGFEYELRAVWGFRMERVVDGGGVGKREI